MKLIKRSLSPSGLARVLIRVIVTGVGVAAQHTGGAGASVKAPPTHLLRAAAFPSSHSAPPSSAFCRQLRKVSCNTPVSAKDTLYHLDIKKSKMRFSDLRNVTHVNSMNLRKRIHAFSIHFIFNKCMWNSNVLFDKMWVKLALAGYETLFAIWQFLHWFWEWDMA